MSPKNSTQDWATDSYSHTFPHIPSGSSDLVQILELLKEYDEVCSDARATMIKQINIVLGNENFPLSHEEKSR
jgi:hypothetical protein